MLFALRTFCATESTKELGTREKSLQAPFAHAAKGEPSVGHLLATPGFRLFSGCCGTCFVRLYKKIYTRTKLQTVLTQWPENSRPSVGFFNGAFSPSATDYLCTQHSTGNSKNKTGTVTETAESPDVGRPLCEDRSNVGRQLYFFKIAARSALPSA